MRAAKSCQRCEAPFMSPGIRCIPCSAKTFSTCTACRQVFADNGSTDKICPKCNRQRTKEAQQAAKRATTAALKAAAHQAPQGQKCTGCNVGFAPQDQQCAYCQGQMSGYSIITCPTCTQPTWSLDGTCRLCATPRQAPNRKCMTCAVDFYTTAGSQVCTKCVTKDRCKACNKVFKNYHIDNRGEVCPKCWQEQI